MESVFGTDSMSAAAQPFQRSLAGPRSRPAALEPSVVAIGRGTLIGAGAVLCLLAAWASGATWYLVSRDEIVARFLAKQTEIQYARTGSARFAPTSTGSPARNFWSRTGSKAAFLI
jgi:hypothetical protein